MRRSRLEIARDQAVLADSAVLSLLIEIAVHD